MALTSALVLLAVIWFMVLFCVIPIRLQTQGDLGRKIRGTGDGSPENPQMWKRARITTSISLAIWAAAVFVITSGAITLEDFDLFTRFGGGGVSPLAD